MACPTAWRLKFFMIRRWWSWAAETAPGGRLFSPASSGDIIHPGHRRGHLASSLDKKIKFKGSITHQREKGQTVTIKNVKTQEEYEVPTDGVFIFIGHKPNTELFRGQLALDERGYIISDMSMHTNIPGVFVAGEVSDPIYRQVVTSAGMGAAAAIAATRFLEANEDTTPEETVNA